MTALETHLAHLIALLAPPYRESWRAYVWDRALTLAKEPEYAALPDMLKVAMSLASGKLKTNQTMTGLFESVEAAMGVKNES